MVRLKTLTNLYDYTRPRSVPRYSYGCRVARASSWRRSRVTHIFFATLSRDAGLFWASWQSILVADGHGILWHLWPEGEQE